MSAPRKFPLKEQAAEAKREVRMRDEVYPSLIARGKLTAELAAERTDLMKAIAQTLELFAEHEGAIRACLAEEIKKKHSREKQESFDLTPQ